MAKPTPLEILLEHSSKIVIFKNMEYKNICLLISNATVRNVNKNELVAVENSPFIDVNIVLYGSFEVSMIGDKIGQLNESDVFGLGSTMYPDQTYLSQTTIKTTSHKGLLLTLKFSPFFLQPCSISAQFHKNTAKYLAKTLSLEHQRFAKDKNEEKGKQ